MDVYVYGLMERLCSSFLEKALFEHCEDDMLKSFSRPSRWSRWSDGHHSRVVKRLKYKLFERLLLEKWKWFGYEVCEMRVESRCLAFAYGLSSRAGMQVQANITKLKKCQLTEKEAILHFLLLMGSGEGDPEDKATFNDSGVCMSNDQESLFENVPRLGDVNGLHSAITSSQHLFECTPGSGFHGWSSELPLDEDKTPLPSSLFCGLTHTRIADINKTLGFPRLLPDKSKTMTTCPLPDLPYQCFKPSGIQSVSMESGYSMSELDRFLWCAQTAESGCLLRQWEGWKSRCCYISETFCFADSANLAVDRLTRLPCDDVVVSSSPTPSTPGHLVHQLIWEMDHLPLNLIKQPPTDGGSIVAALANLLQLLLTYCRSQLSTLTDTCSSELMLCTQAHHVLPLCKFIVELVSVVPSFPKGLDLVNRIYNQAIIAQSGHLYPLLLGFLSYILEPYLRFVEQWVFLGQLDWGEEFGIYGNQEALNRQDEEYWRSGYVMVSCCSPAFLECHANTILTAGKALNLLKLCSPKHPLCSGETRPFSLRLRFNAETLEGVHSECERYREVIREQINSRERERVEKLEAVKAKARRELEKRREEAIKEAQRIKMAEEASLAALKEKKQSLLRELQQQIKTARAVKVEVAADEKRREAAVMKMMTQREESMTAVVRSEMLTHYGELTREVELRQARAKWRVKRLNLQEKRIQFLQSEERRWKDDNETCVEGNPELVPSLHSHQLSPSSHDHNTVPHDQDNTSPDFSSLEVKTEEKTVLSDSAPEKESTPPSEYTDLMNQQIPDIHSKLRSQTPPVNRSHTSSVKELIYPDAAVANEQGNPHLLTTMDPSRAINEQGYPRMFSTRGHAPRSTVEEIIYGSVEPLSQEVVSTRGHAPPSTIQHLLYPLRQVAPTNMDKSGFHDNQECTDDDMTDLVEFGPSSKFTDEYDELDEPPGRDMLCSLLGPLISDPTPVDTLFLSLYPLDALLETSLTLPIITQSDLVNKALLDHFLTTCSIQIHFTAIKRFLLLEDGEFAHVLCNGLCEELAYGAVPLYVCSSSFLNPLLCLALESSLHGRTPQAQRLAFKLKCRPSIIHTQAVNALEFLELKYEVDWPINIVITSSMLDKYNKVFHLLLQMKRASWALKTAFHHLRQQQGLGEHKTRQLQTYRHQFQHFVNIMHGYVANQLFYISWREFEVELSTKVHSLDELIQAHAKFIDNTLFRCLLSKKAKPVMNIVQEILSCILRFSSQSAMVTTTSNNTYRALCDTQRKFSNAAQLLIKVVSKLVARGYQPHLEDLLLRLNYNSFYGSQ